MFDITSIQILDSAEIELIHPTTGEPLGASVTVAGPDHPARKKLLHSLQRRLRAQALRRKPGAIDPEADAEEAIENLAAITLGWEGIQEAGKPLAFSQEAAIRLYTQAQWLADQVNQGVSDKENFIVDAKPT